MQLLRWGLGTGLIVLLVVLFLRRQALQELLRMATLLQPVMLVALLVLLALAKLLQVEMLRRAFDVCGASTSWRECFVMVGLRSLYNMGFSGAGIAAQYAHARVALGIGTQPFVAATAVTSLASIVTLSALAAGLAGSVAAVSLRWALWIGLSAAFCALAAGVMACLVLAPPPRALALPWLGKMLQKMGIPSTGTNPCGSFAGISAAALAVHVLRIARLEVLLATTAVGWAYVAGAAAAADMVAQIPITPAGLGTREAIFGVFGSFASLFQPFVAAVLIDRVLAVIMHVAHGILALVMMHERGWLAR